MLEQWETIKNLRAALDAAESERDSAMCQIRDAHNALTAFGVPCEPHTAHDGCETQLGHRIRMMLGKLSDDLAAARTLIRSMLGQQRGYRAGCKCNGCREIAAALREDA